MLEPTSHAPQTPFTDFPADLHKWGYSTYEQAGPDLDYSGKGLEAALRAIGASTNPNDWITHLVQHSPVFNQAADGKQYNVDGAMYPATGARYESVLNPKDGIVM
jgi:hypothetical protein